MRKLFFGGYLELNVTRCYAAMHPFETNSIVESNQSRCEDRLAIIDGEDSVLIVVADGAGGTGSGDLAAETVVREVTTSAHLLQTPQACCDSLRQIDMSIGAGESTAVLIRVFEDRLVGASVGDSVAWMVDGGQLLDLTRKQIRKPLLGSGEAQPIGFAHSGLRGTLIVASDGFANYVKRTELLQRLPYWDMIEIPRKLVGMVRLPSGDLWDDVAVVVCRHRPRRASRQRYELL